MADYTSSPSPDAFVCVTSDLESRFNISKSTRTKRMNQLGLFPEKLHKDGKKYWLTQQQLDIFADFHQYITNNGSEEGYHLLHVSPTDLAEDEPISQLERYNDDLSIGIEETEAASGELALQEQASPDIAYTTVTGEFANTNFATADPSELLMRQLTQNAQNRAAAILVAEKTLTNQYINNPQALDPQLLAQVNAVAIPSIDPKEFAAKLISGAQRTGHNI